MVPIINPQKFKFLLPGVIFTKNCSKRKVYFTFDDGPDPIATPFVLKELAKYNAKATFFVTGKNAEKFPDLLKQISEEGHALGNHTYSHISGWSTTNNGYLEEVKKCSDIVRSSLFRPPYGRIYPWQALKIQRAGYQIVMWDLLTYDFNIKLLSKKPIEKMLKRIKDGSIIVFHDTPKPLENLKNLLPRYLEYCHREGLVFDSL